MFSRLKEAIRILSYREPNNGADSVIVEREETTVSRSGVFISNVLEGLAAVCTLGYAAGRIGSYIEKIIPDHASASLGTIVGAVGVLLALTLHWIKQDLEKKLRAKLHVADAMAPYFGHRLENVGRILKGRTSVA